MQLLRSIGDRETRFEIVAAIDYDSGMFQNFF